jgi:hypothetical protein
MPSSLLDFSIHDFRPQPGTDINPHQTGDALPYPLRFGPDLRYQVGREGDGQWGVFWFGHNAFLLIRPVASPRSITAMTADISPVAFAAGTMERNTSSVARSVAYALPFISNVWFMVAFLPGLPARRGVELLVDYGFFDFLREIVD